MLESQVPGRRRRISLRSAWEGRLALGFLFLFVIGLDAGIVLGLLV